MDFNFLNKKLIETVYSSSYSFFSFYSGYNTSRFISALISSITTSANIFLLNFSEAALNSISLYYTKSIVKKNSKKFTPQSVIAISDRVLLLDLISHRKTKEMINAIIIGDKAQIENDSKIIFILKILKENIGIKIIYVSDNALLFSKNLHCILSNVNIDKSKLNLNFIPRFHNIIEGIVDYAFKYKEISIEEYNIKNNNEVSEKIHKLLIRLRNMIIEEIAQLVKNKEQKDTIYKYIDTMLSCDLLSNKEIQFLNDFFGNISYKASILFNDLNSVKNLLMHSDNNDLASILGIFHFIQKQAQSHNFEQHNEYSIWNYEDKETQDILFELNDLLKSNIYTISKEKVTDEEEIKKIEEFVEISNKMPDADKYKEFLLNSKVNINYNSFEKIYQQYTKLIEILEEMKDKKEKILIIVKNKTIQDTLKEILINHFIVKDNYKTFFDNRLRNYLVLKNEFLKRRNTLQKNIKTNYYYETLLLQYMCYKLSGISEEKKQNIFEMILNEYNKNEELLPSEIEISEDIYKEFDQTYYSPDKIIENCYIDILSLTKSKEESVLALYDKLLSYNYTNVIIFNASTYILRFIEDYIANKEQCSIKTITLLNQINSYSFNTEINWLRSEFLQFKKNMLNYKSYIKEEASNSIKMDIIEEPSSENNILIDYREKGANTIYYLYSKGFNIIQAALEIGDYITSNTVCIERKSISSGDLFQSLRSSKNRSRLVEQINKMEKYYNIIIVLCEFDEYRDVERLYNSSLFTSKDLYKNMLELKNISKKLVYFWSISSQMTADLLFELKNKYKNDLLDVNRCININKNTKRSKITSSKSSLDKTQNSIMSYFQGEAIKEEDEDSLEKYEEKGDTVDNSKRMIINIEKFIRSIDGINTNNYHLVRDNFKTLKEFILSPPERLYDIFGRINGNKIYLYFNFNVNS